MEIAIIVSCIVLGITLLTGVCIFLVNRLNSRS